MPCDDHTAASDAASTLIEVSKTVAVHDYRIGEVERKLSAELLAVKYDLGELSHKVSDLPIFIEQKFREQMASRGRVRRSVFDVSLQVLTFLVALASAYAAFRAGVKP